VGRVNLVFFLKPDAVIRRYVGARTLKVLIDRIPEIEFLCFEGMYAERDFLANEHYVEHKGKFFYKWLVDYISSAPILFSIVRVSEEDVATIRRILGPTLPEKAAVEAPTTIRALYGIMGGVNVAHASDAVDTAKRESEIWMRYLKEKQGLDIEKADPKNVLSTIQSYIDKYIDYPIIDSIRYREILTDLKAGRIERENAELKITSLLNKETEDRFIKGKITEVLARITIDSVLLRR